MKPISDIVVAVADAYGMEPGRVTSRDRDRPTYIARGHAIWLSFLEGHDIRDICEAFRRDMTSVHAAMGAYHHHHAKGCCKHIDLRRIAG